MGDEPVTITNLIEHLDALLDEPAPPNGPGDPIADFLDSDWIYNHLLTMGRDVLDNFRSKVYVTSPVNNGRFVALHGHETGSGKRRTLSLQNGQSESSIHQAAPEQRVTISFADMVVDKFRIAGDNPEHAYSSPDKSLCLHFVETVTVPARVPLVRRDPSDVFVIKASQDFRALVYIDHSSESSYQLAFDKKNLQFLGTSMADVTASKSITLLEILEQLGSDFLGEAAVEMTGHRSPIVRWRSLSSLNKISHPAVTSILEKFRDDETLFIANAAKRVLNQGRIK